MHGHQIRREVELKKVETWGGVSVGALYRELHTMEREGLVVAVRNEQVGRRPARTVYRITEEGTRELALLTEQAIGEFCRRADSLGVGLLFGSTPDGAEVGSLLGDRRKSIRTLLEGLVAERERLRSEGRLSPVGQAVFRRSELALEAELAWHDEFDEALTAGRRGTPETRATGTSDAAGVLELSQPPADVRIRRDTLRKRRSAR